MFTLDVVIETPKGSAQKYDYDPSTRFFKLKKILPQGMVFPYDFGFIPDTKGEDGDPLDVIMISEFSSFPGCMVKCKLIGGFKAEQSQKPGKNKMIRNDRFVVMPMCTKMFAKIETLKDLPLEVIKELKDFFVDYNKIEGKKFEILKILEVKDARKVLHDSLNKK